MLQTATCCHISRTSVKTELCVFFNRKQLAPETATELRQQRASGFLDSEQRRWLRAPSSWNHGFHLSWAPSDLLREHGDVPGPCLCNHDDCCNDDNASIQSSLESKMKQIDINVSIFVWLGFALAKPSCFIRKCLQVFLWLFHFTHGKKNVPSEIDCACVFPTYFTISWQSSTKVCFYCYNDTKMGSKPTLLRSCTGSAGDH